MSEIGRSTAEAEQDGVLLRIHQPGNIFLRQARFANQKTNQLNFY
jgi:hypothetical protein